MQCGARVPPAQSIPDAPLPKLDFVQPALLGGMALGLLSSIPIINAGNCLCCMWVLGGGALASYMLMKQRPSGITYGDGAFGGVLSGLFGSVVATIISIPIRLIAARVFESQKGTLELLLRDVPAGPMHEILNQMISPEISFVSLLITFLSNVVLFSLFAMIGGILMVAIMERQKRSV